MILLKYPLDDRGPIISAHADEFVGGVDAGNLRVDLNDSVKELRIELSGHFRRDRYGPAGRDRYTRNSRQTFCGG